MSDQKQVSSFTDGELNDLIKKTPPNGKKRSIPLIAAVATLGSLLFGYDTGVLAGALPYLYMPNAAGGLHLNPVEEGLVGGLLMVGAGFGAIIGGRLSDRYGRRHNILLLAAIFFFGALGCSLSLNFWMLCIFRIILGFAVGGASATVPVYLAETAPKEVRGPIVAIDQFMIVFGQFLAYSMNAIIARINHGPHVITEAGESIDWDHAKAMSDLVVVGGNGATWRYMLILATIPAIALWILMRTMPETSRWYAAKHRYHEAIASLKRVRDPKKHNLGLEVREMIEVNREYENQPQMTLRQVFATQWTRKVLFLGVAISIIDPLTGINTAMYYMPKVLHAAGFSSENAIMLNVVTGFFSCIGAAIGIYFVARFARRHVAMYQETGIVLSLFGLAALFFWVIEPHMDEAGNIASTVPTFAPWAVLVIITAFLFFKQSGTVTWVLVTEIFPANTRGVSQGTAVSVNWFANAVITAIFPSMMAYLGGAKTYLVFALINCVSLYFYTKILPETKYHTLEELEAEFEKRYSK